MSDAFQVLRGSEIALLSRFQQQFGLVTTLFSCHKKLNEPLMYIGIGYGNGYLVVVSILNIVSSVFEEFVPIFLWQIVVRMG